MPTAIIPDGYAGANEVAALLNHSTGHSLLLMRDEIPSMMVGARRYCKESDLLAYHEAREAVYAAHATWITTRTIAEALEMKLQTCAYKLFALKKAGKIIGRMGVHRLTDKIFYNTYFWPPETVDVLRDVVPVARQRSKLAPDWFAIPFADGEEKRQAKIRKELNGEGVRFVDTKPGLCACGQPARIVFEKEEVVTALCGRCWLVSEDYRR